MFLYRNDVDNRVFIDYHTTNNSFLKMHLALKKMDVQNNKFFLSLTQPDLIGIDPHNLKDNSLELRLKIIYECKINPWYFFREVARIPEIGSVSGARFRLDRANLAMYWLFFNNISLLEIIPRQIGKTVSTLVLSGYNIFISGYKFSQCLLTRDSKLRVNSINYLKSVRDALPPYLVFNQNKDADNTEKITYNRLENEYITFVAQKQRMAAEAMGRGLTIPVQHWDEVCYFSYIHYTYNQAISSTNAAVDAAKLNDQPYGNILTTTAGQLDTPEGRFVYDLLLKSLAFSERFYDINNREELHKLVKANSKQMMVYCEFSFLQLGKTLEWFREKSDKITDGIDVIKRDYLNIFTYGSKETAVKEKMLNTIRKSLKEPEFIQTYDDFIVRWYVSKEELDKIDISNFPMLIGSDPSESIERDFFTFVFMNPINMSVMATCRCNTTNLIEIGIFIVKLIEKFKKSLYIIERNSTGGAILDVLFKELPKRGINPYRRIFNKVIQEKDSEKFKDHDIDNYYVTGTDRNLFGFRMTSSKTEGRNFIYKTVFFEALDRTADKIYDKNLIDEICGLQKKNGRIDHPLNNHDDLVIAFVYCCYVLLYGKNLKYYDFYKGNQDKIMSDVCKVVSEREDITNFALDIVEVKKKIMELDREITGESNSVNKIKKMHQIVALKEMLVDANENALLVPKSDKGLKTFDRLSLPVQKNELIDVRNNQQTLNTYFNFI